MRMFLARSSSSFSFPFGELAVSSCQQPCQIKHMITNPSKALPRRVSLLLTLVLLLVASMLWGCSTNQPSKNKLVKDRDLAPESSRSGNLVSKDNVSGDFAGFGLQLKADLVLSTEDLKVLKVVKSSMPGHSAGETFSIGTLNNRFPTGSTSTASLAIVIFPNEIRLSFGEADRIILGVERTLRNAGVRQVICEVLACGSWVEIRAGKLDHHRRLAPAAHRKARRDQAPCGC